jgi:signal recognition particle subunit SRP54
MFEELSDKFQEALKSLRGQDKLTEANMAGAVKTVKRALLDADVNLDVIEEFLAEVKNKAVGEEVVRGVRAEQKFISLINKELMDVLGGEVSEIHKKNKGTTVIMLIGLQGAGKTTAAAKLGLFFKDKRDKVLLIAADTFRPAAKDQLKALGKQTGIDVFTEDESKRSLEIVENGIRQGEVGNYDIVIIDTAGRLYIDQELMNELRELKEIARPDEILLVVDSMIGQEAAELTRSFNKTIGITGAILTKMDGDSRGGAALSVKKVSGKPIKFIGTGEKVEALEQFYPDRIASRILGMGDILTLVDKAQKEVEIEDVINMQKKFEEASFDFNDFLKQMKLIKKMGSIGGLLRLVPGMAKIDQGTLKTGEEKLQRIESMINSMTKLERQEPILLIRDHKRRSRIARGCGKTVGEVDKVIRDFERMKVMMKGIARGDMSRVDTNDNKGRYPGDNRLSGKKKSIERNQQKIEKKKKGFFEL